MVVRPSLLILTISIGLQALPIRDRVIAYRQTGAESDRAALAEERASVSQSLRPYLSLALGIAEFDLERYDSAIRGLKAAESEAEVLKDYAVFYRGRAFAKSERFSQAAWVLRDFSDRFPLSPLLSDAAQVRAESLIRDNRLAEARQFLSDSGAGFDKSDQHYLLGRVAHLEGRSLDAVEQYRRAYYQHPLSERAGEAEARLDGLRRTLGDAYPKALAEWRLRRADLLFEAGQFATAAAEYSRARPGLKGVDRERARVRQAAANYRRLHTTSARNLLSGWEPDDRELAAERLYYLAECARRKNQVTLYRDLVARLSREHPKSSWRQEALFSIGNFYLLRNDGRQYRSYYEQAARALPDGKHSAKAHWKVAWRAYLDGDPRSRSLFEEHARLYPASGQASAALYWVGRLSESAGSLSQAKALYQAIDDRYPNYYYGYLSRRRLVGLAEASPRLDEALHATVENLTPPRRLAPAPSSETKSVIERGRLLSELGLDDLAQRELTRVSYREPDAHHVGLELARQSIRNDDHFRAMRHMKRYAFGYLRFPLDQLPRAFWERLYPLPFERSLRARSKPHALDPYLVAGLIRQESEFNPSAVSRAGAIGLMQIMPSTGRDLARRLGVQRFTTRRLREPDVSLRLGVFHLKGVIQQFSGNLEISLAAYNAGSARADRWVQWGDFDEPGEFAETIPFTETRGYVQSVLRNRDVYRRLYDGSSRAASAPSRFMLASGEPMP